MTVVHLPEKPEVVVPDGPRLWKVLAHIRELEARQHEDRYQGDMWCQGVWRNEMGCGTVACFAGWAVQMFAPDTAVLSGAYVYFPDGRKLVVREYAMELLGLTDNQSDWLFAGSNTLAEPKRLIGRITGR
jgi:hypothetical protein